MEATDHRAKLQISGAKINLSFFLSSLTQVKEVIEVIKVILLHSTRKLINSATKSVEISSTTQEDDYEKTRVYETTAGSLMLTRCVV